MVNDPFINVTELNIELKNMQQMAESLNIHFPLLSQKIAYIFSRVEACKTIQDADEYFDLLNNIQGGLACI